MLWHELSSGLLRVNREAIIEREMQTVDRIRNYYAQFDEWGRLDTPAGKLEFAIVMRILKEGLRPDSEILDLGSGPGRYSFSLAEQGHRVWLADLSPALVAEANTRCSKQDKAIRKRVCGIDVVSATDLSIYRDCMFDAALLFGPLYHLAQGDAEKCLRELGTKLRPGGVLFAVYMPYEVGLKSVLERAFYAPAQVDRDNLAVVVEKGYFRNNTDQGFQEGYFHTTTDVLDLLGTTGFRVENVRSIHGIAYGNEKAMMEKETQDPTLFRNLLDIVDQTASLESVVNTGGHALVTAVVEDRAT